MREKEKGVTSEHEELTKKDRGLSSNTLVPSTPIAFVANKWYPLLWVVVGQLLMLSLLIVSDLSILSQNIYAVVVEGTLIFSRLNLYPPFSSGIAKAYTVLMVLATPIQLVTLFKIDRDHVMEVFMKKGTSGISGATIFVASALVLATIFPPPYQAGLARTLGDGLLAVSIIIPIITSILPLAIRLAWCWLLQK